MDKRISLISYSYQTEQNVEIIRWKADEPDVRQEFKGTLRAPRD